MRGKLQGRSEIVIQAPLAQIWRILEDSEVNLPRLWPMVQRCAIASGGKERVGAVRTCDVAWVGRTGQTVERCIESVPNRKLSHAIEQDSFGFTRMLSDFWFSFVLEPQGAEVTLVRVETHYGPKGLRGRVMSALMIKRKFREVRETALVNLKELAEGDSELGEPARAAFGA